MNLWIFSTTLLYVCRVPASSFFVIVLFCMMIFQRISISNYKTHRFSSSEIFLVTALSLMSLRILIKQINLASIELIYILGNIVFLLYFFSVRELNLSSKLFHAVGLGIIMTIIISLLEVVFGIHMPTSRYNDVANMASTWDYNRPTAFFYNENDMINALACMLPFAFVFYKQALAQILLLISTLILSVYIASKSAIITIVLYLVVFLYLNVLKKSTYIYSKLIIFIVIISLVYYFTTNSIYSSEYFDNAYSRFSGFFSALFGNGIDGSTGERKEIYAASYNFLISNLDVLLIGNGSFDDYNYIVKSAYGVRNGDFHNIFLEVITIGGVISFIAISLAYAFTIVISAKIKTEAKAYIVMLLCIYPFITSFGSSSVLRFPFLFLMILFVNVLYRDACKWRIYNAS